MVAVGVSRYADVRMNLKYAAKHALESVRWHNGLFTFSVLIFRCFNSY